MTLIFQVSLNAISINLMASFLQAMADENYWAANHLKNEIVNNVEVLDY